MNDRQSSAPCVNCGKSNCWYEPECRRCGLNLWTNTFEPFCDFMIRRFGKCMCYRHESPKLPDPQPESPPVRKYPPRIVTQK